MIGKCWRRKRGSLCWFTSRVSAKASARPGSPSKWSTELPGTHVLGHRHLLSPGALAGNRIASREILRLTSGSLIWDTDVQHMASSATTQLTIPMFNFQTALYHMLKNPEGETAKVKNQTNLNRVQFKRKDTNEILKNIMNFNFTKVSRHELPLSHLGH